MRLETERLLLRRPGPEDLDEYAVIFADPEVVRFTSGQTRTREQTAEGMRRMIAHWDRHEIGLFSVVRSDDDRLIGRVGFLLWDTERWIHALAAELAGPTETEIGWTLGREFWGQGYATEAALAARDWGLGELGLARLISLIQVGNERSKRVARKLGMEAERTIRRDTGGLTEVWALER